jgi:hypothetical protein
MRAHVVTVVDTVARCLLGGEDETEAELAQRRST